MKADRVRQLVQWPHFSKKSIKRGVFVSVILRDIIYVQPQPPYMAPENKSVYLNDSNILNV